MNSDKEHMSQRTKPNIKIGAHLSTSGGIHKAVEKADKIGASCIQVFSGSPRMWRRTPLDRIDKVKLFSKQEEFSVTPIFTHALYLINLASDKDELLAKSTMALKHDLEFDSFVKGAGVIVHLGSHQGRGWEHDKEQVKNLIIEVLQDTPDDSQLLIENSAGQNGKLCSNIEEIKWLFDQVKPTLDNSSRLGWCFDTCHGHAAGYILGKEGSDADSNSNSNNNYTTSRNTQIGQASLLEELKGGQTESNVISEIERLDMWKTLKCVHVNDSRDGYNTGKDRHANIGEGKIPGEDMKYFVWKVAEKSIPIILETPGVDKEGPNAENINRVRAFLGN